jgi:hypothetical protein
MLDSGYFKYWLDGVVGTCELIASQDAFRRTWLAGETSVTSIHYFDELLEQMLGDLRLEENAAGFAEALRELGVLDAVSAFCDALVSIKQSVDKHTELQDQVVLLSSECWRTLQAAAIRVIEQPSLKAYRSGRKDIQIPGESGPGV